MFRPKELTGALSCNAFDHIGVLLPPVIASARITLGVFIGENRPEGRHHFRIGIVFRWNHFDAISLSTLLSANSIRYIGIERFELHAIGIHWLSLQSAE